MNIVVYIEPLKTFTSGMPHRGMLKELIGLRTNDFFTLVVRKGPTPSFLDDFLKDLKQFNNWNLIIEKRSSRTSNILAFFRIKNHCRITTEGDIYLNFDANYLGNDKKPQIITVHDLSSVKSNKFSSISYIKRLARKFTIANGIKHADHIISISEFTKNDIIEYYNTSKLIDVIHNGIHPMWFDYKSKKISVRQKYWVWWGNFNKRKNLKQLLQAYEKMITENSNHLDEIPSILFIGNKNQYFDQLSNYIDSSELLKKKTFFKDQLELVDLINCVANSQGLLFPSLYEGFGLPVIESLSQGVPVLTSNNSSLPEISGGNAILVNPTDVVDIKNGLAKLLIKSEKIDEEILKEWAANFTYKKCALNYSKIIENCKAANE